MLKKIKNQFATWKIVFFSKYWSDPVWSKVISAIIISLGGGVIVFLISAARSISNNQTLKTTLTDTLNFFVSYTLVNNSLLAILAVALLYKAILFIKSIRFITKQKDGKEYLRYIKETSTSFVYGRIAEAFPGERDLKWYDNSKDIRMRLNVFFRQPIEFETTSEYGKSSTPIWWFRGGANSNIINFKILSKKTLLIGYKELKVKRIAVMKHSDYKKCFIYVESSALEPVGIYNMAIGYEALAIEKIGYLSEEYAIFKGKPITREQYDDGAIFVRGRSIDVRTKAELRVRYLSTYNFIIAAAHSPFASANFRNESRNHFDDVLSGKMSYDDFFKYLETVKKDPLEMI